MLVKSSNGSCSESDPGKPDLRYGRMKQGGALVHGTREEIESALKGEDVAQYFASAGDTWRTKMPPRRYRFTPSVVTFSGRGLERLARYVLFPFDRLTDPIGTVQDWVTDKIPFRRKKRPLVGGWRSTAGSLVAAVQSPAQNYLVCGHSGLHVVFAGDLGSELGWSVPKEKVRGVEHLTWDWNKATEATVRFHFEDGSWGDLLIVDKSWKQVLALYPAAMTT